jgi:hypothetical protein
MLITDLAGYEFLDVLGRDRVKAVLAAGDRTDGIDLKGSFLVVSSRVRVMAQLVDFKTGSVIRAVRSEGPEAEIFGIIDDISAQVRSGLQGVIAERLGRPVDLADSDARVSDRLLAMSEAKSAEDVSGAWTDGKAKAPAPDADLNGPVPSVLPLDPLGNEARSPAKDRAFAAKAADANLAGESFEADVPAPPEETATSVAIGTPEGHSADTGMVRALRKAAEAKPAASPSFFRFADGAAQQRQEEGAAPLPPLVTAMKLRYQAQLVLDKSEDVASLEKSLHLLELAEEAAPDLRGLSQEINQVRQKMGTAGD